MKESCLNCKSRITGKVSGMAKTIHLCGKHNNQTIEGKALQQVQCNNVGVNGFEPYIPVSCKESVISSSDERLN